MEQLKKIPRDQWKQCPIRDCNNTGGYPEPRMNMYPDGTEYVDWEEEQCEFCWTVDESVFNQKRLLENETTKAD